MIFAIKALGAISVFAAIFLFVLMKTGEKRKKLSSLGNLISSLKYMGDLINISSLPLIEIFSQVKEKADENAFFFEELIEGLKNPENREFSLLWDEALEHMREKNLFPEAVVEALKTLGKRLGKMTVEIENENIRQVICLLKKEEDDLREEFMRDSKLFKRLGAVFSALLVLVLI